MKSDRQYRDAATGAFIGWIGILVTCIIMVLFSGCYGTYYLTDAEYSDAREENASITYYNSQIYSGWNTGYYYYYGMPHYYPWNYYYNTCPPSHHNTSTHIVITRPVNRPNTHRPNIRTNSNTRVIVTPNRNTRVKTNTNYNRPSNTKVKTNRSNKTKVTNRRRPK